MQNNSLTIVNKLSLPLGLITWIVFMVMGYGFKVDWLYNNKFWIWFPLWIGPALYIAICLILFAVFALSEIIKHLKKKGTK